MDEVANLRLAIAREIHDGIAQEVTALGYKIDELIGLHSTPEDMRSELRILRTRITTISGTIRDEIFQLRGLDPRPLQDVIEAIGEDLIAGTSIDLQVRLGTEPPIHVRASLIKIIQEAIINAKTHSTATWIEVACNEESVVIRDNGGGQYIHSDQRWGSSGMRERAKDIGATVSFSTDESGAVVTFSWSPVK